MRKIALAVLASFSGLVSAQFKVEVEAPANFAPNEVYVYTLNGSKDILHSKQVKKGNSWKFNFTEPYSGMLKLYFPQNNASVNFISENRDVNFKFETENNKIKNVVYLDEPNKLMNSMQDIQQKQEFILPALYQIKEYYGNSDAFGAALNVEIARLSGANSVSAQNYPFINFYNTNYNKYVVKNATAPKHTHTDLISFFQKSNHLLETSSLMRPILMTYLNIGPNTNLRQDIDKLLAALNLETPRGQTVLSELIELFGMYEMNDLKQHYLTEAKNLKCTINDRLSGTIAVNTNTEIGATFTDYKFTNAANTTAKSIHGVKADRKVIFFWSSTCSHCISELPKLLEKYSAMKAKNTEIIGLSLDSEEKSYRDKAQSLPWINDAELRGWYSSYAETYGVSATPTFFILDSSNKIIAKPDHASDVFQYLKIN